MSSWYDSFTLTACKTMTNPFPTIHPVYLIYFFCGAAFLFLSFSIGTKNMQGSNLRIADSLWMLAMFGLLHGLREWLEIYPLLEGPHLTVEAIFSIQVIAVALLIGSFLFLLQFGLSLFPARQRKRVMWTMGAYTAVILISIIFLELSRFSSPLQNVRQVQIGARNILGLLGGALTSYGLIRYSNSQEIAGLHSSISRNISYAGGVFAVYSFLATTFFSSIANLYLPYSKEVLRGWAAALIAYFITKALNVFDIETRGKVGDQARQLVQSEKLASLGRLAAGIAHEINNPLTNASLGIQLLRKKRDNWQAAAGQLDAVERNIDRASAIARELLQFSRQQEAAFLPVNINEAIARALVWMDHQLGRVVVEQDLAPVPEVMGDRLKLEQVFINVLSNALEAMPEGGRLSIATVSNEGMVEVRISDTGTGIAEENLSKVFDPFFTTKEVGSGTGLGLYLCYGIIRQHCGLIDISSSVGQGTTVSISIPAKSKEG
jgi:two-component system NtrC family sensor kinase